MLKKNVVRIRKKTFHLQFLVETPDGHQESMFLLPQKWKKQRYIIRDLSEKVCKLNSKL
jgi:hypothetical protein